MAEPLRLFILAGEPSGDRLGADLVGALRDRRPVALTGVGGDALAAAGLASLFPMSDLSVMGWRDVLGRLPLLLWRVRQVAAAILSQRPDLVVLVDAQVFSALVARRIRNAGGRMPIVLYVAPSVWAWKPERAAALAPLFDAVLAVLPFEPAVMRRLGGPPTSYVGHPGLAAFPLRPLQPKAGPVLLLPGSREGELRRHLPLMRAVAQRLAGTPGVAGFVLPTPARFVPRIQVEVATWSLPVRVIGTEAEKRQAFAEAVAACASTGTVTLELAFAGVPMVTAYVADAGQARRFRRYGVRFAALPNIVLSRPLVPEHLFVAPRPEEVADDLADLIVSPERLAGQRAGFAELRSLMEKGAPEAPLADAAARILSLLDQRVAMSV